MSSRQSDKPHATREARLVKRGINKAQADEIGRILVRECETNEDSGAKAGLEPTGNCCEAAVVEPKAAYRELQQVNGRVLAKFPQ